MARLLMLTDRPRDGLRDYQTALRLAERLNASDVAALVARPQQAVIPAGFDATLPDGGLGTVWTSPWPMDVAIPSVEEVESLFQACHRESLWRGVRCETQQTRLMLVTAAATVSRLFGLLVVSGASLRDENGEAYWMRNLCQQVDRPLLVTNGNGDINDWRRIVVAGSTPQEHNQLMRWGEHWSEELCLPLQSLELPQPTPTIWPWMRSVWQLLSPAMHRQAVRESLAAFHLDAHDLLLVGRRTLHWPDQAGGVFISPTDLIESPLAAVGLLPTTLDHAACQLLFSDFDSFDAPLATNEVFAA